MCVLSQQLCTFLKYSLFTPPDLIEPLTCVIAPLRSLTPFYKWFAFFHNLGTFENNLNHRYSIGSERVWWKITYTAKQFLR